MYFYRETTHRNILRLLDVATTLPNYDTTHIRTAQR